MTTILTTLLAGILVVVFGALGSAKLAAVPAMRERADHVGYSVSAYRRIGLLEVLGALGVLAGAVLPVLGALAALGLLVLMAGALVVHARNRDGLAKAAPAIVISLLVVAFLALLVGGSR